MTFSYLSVCSGLEAATLAFHPLGARPVGFAEIEPFPSAIIAHHYGSNMPGDQLSHNAPPNFGDFTKIDVASIGRVDVLIGGTPCQAFSVAGNRISLSDERGNLSLSYAVLAHELVRFCGLRNCVWENVPGVLSTHDNAFGCFLAAIVGADDALRTPDGGRWPDAGMVAGPRARAAWRVFDAQYFGLAQRRRRVFLVADFGNGADPAAVLFEPKSLRWNNPPRRKKGEEIAQTIAARTRGGGGLGADFECDGGLIVSTGDVPHCLNAGAMGRQDYETETLIAHSLRAAGFYASEDGTGRGTPIIAVPNSLGASEEAQSQLLLALESREGHIGFSFKDFGADALEELSPTMRSLGAQGANGGSHRAVAYDMRGREGGAQFEGPHDTASIRSASGGSSRSYVAERLVVRRLTVEECEAIQGIPRGYTRIPWRGKPSDECPDGPRYKAIGNSWAVPVVRWIGKRLLSAMEPRP